MFASIAITGSGSGGGAGAGVIGGGGRSGPRPGWPSAPIPRLSATKPKITIASIRQAKTIFAACGTDRARQLVPIVVGALARLAGPSTVFDALWG